MSTLDAIHRQQNAVMGTRNGVSIPMSYGSATAEHSAVRKNILMTDYSHFGIAQISGDSAYELLNLVVAGDVSSIRDEQAMYTIIMDRDGKIVTDLYILCDDERFVLLCEWLRGDELCRLLQDAYQGREDEFEEIDEIRPLDGELGMIHFEGPYSWELLAELYGMDVIGLPFQEHMHIEDDFVLLRSGKHGEYSYKLIAPREALADIWQQALDAGGKYDLQAGGLGYQRLVRLENPCWEPGLFSDFSRCPIELQMQWAVRYDKSEFAGQEALNARLEQGVPQRVVGFIIREQLAILPQVGDKVCLGPEQIGSVVACGYSADLDACLGRMMLRSDLAYADIDRYQVQTQGGSVAVTTSAVPFARNFSFLVNPSEHSYVDASRPKHLLEQMEWQQQKAEEEKRKKAAEDQAAAE